VSETELFGETQTPPTPKRHSPGFRRDFDTSSHRHDRASRHVRTSMTSTTRSADC
jgi:hypothetical protein